MHEDFDTKLAAAGEMFDKLASEQGLSISDFTDEEAADLLTTIMDTGGKVANVDETPAAQAQVAAATPAAATPKVASANDQLLYAQAYQEVTKQAAAQNIDVTQVDPAELHNAVIKQAQLMSDPTHQAKVAALNEKVAEADMLGRVMAHSYVDELSKIAAANGGDNKQEKKAAFVAALRAKSAGELPPQFAANAAKKKDGEGDEDDKDKEKKEEEEKKASLVLARVQGHLLSQGIDPSTGEKLAASAEIDAEAMRILKEKGWV